MLNLDVLKPPVKVRIQPFLEDVLKKTGQEEVVSIYVVGSSVTPDFTSDSDTNTLFIISGAAVFYSLRSRKAGGFVKERILRILIPYVIIGIFVIAPPQVYLERLTHGEFSGNFFQFYYPHYFDGIYPFGGNFAIIPMHLWYLMDLFIFSLILLPLFIPRGNPGESLISRLAIRFEKFWDNFVQRPSFRQGDLVGGSISVSVGQGSGPLVGVVPEVNPWHIGNGIHHLPLYDSQNSLPVR